MTVSTLPFVVSGKTDIGKVRKHNEDSFIIGSDLKKNRWEFDDRLVVPSKFGALLILADGAGGINANGEAISEPAVNAVAEKFRNLQTLPTSDAQARQLLQAVMLEAHQVILEKIQQNSVYKNPNTTLIIAWLLENKAHIAWSGDSRAYLLRNQNGELLTDDHSMVWQLVRKDQLTPEQARLHTDRHILTQCLGNEEIPPQPEALTARLKEGDRLVLSSDGLHSMMKQEDFIRILKYYETPTECCKGLIDGANYAGGLDNSTAIVVDFGTNENTKTEKTPSKSSTGNVANDIVKVKAPVEESVTENPKDAVIAGLLVIGFLIVFLFGFVFTNQLAGVAELPDEEETPQEILENIAQESENQEEIPEQLPLLPEGTPDRMPEIVAENTEEIEVDTAQNEPENVTETRPETTDNQDNNTSENTSDTEQNPDEANQLQQSLQTILDRKDQSYKKINTLRVRTMTAEEKAIFQTIQTDFSKLYPLLKTITDANSKLKSSITTTKAQQVLQETTQVLNKMEQNFQKLE